MRGARCKAIRAAVNIEFGRRPLKTTFVSANEYLPSEWRRLKKAYMLSRRSDLR